MPVRTQRPFANLFCSKPNLGHLSLYFTQWRRTLLHSQGDYLTWQTLLCVHTCLLFLLFLTTSYISGFLTVELKSKMAVLKYLLRERRMAYHYSMISTPPQERDIQRKEMLKNRTVTQERIHYSLVIFTSCLHFPWVWSGIHYSPLSSEHSCEASKVEKWFSPRSLCGFHGSVETGIQSPASQSNALNNRDVTFYLFLTNEGGKDSRNSSLCEVFFGTLIKRKGKEGFFSLHKLSKSGLITL